MAAVAFAPIPTPAHHLRSAHQPYAPTLSTRTAPIVRPLFGTNNNSRAPRQYRQPMVQPRTSVVGAPAAGGYKFDPFGDDTSFLNLHPAPPPPAPRLAPASLPPKKPYNHQLAQQAKKAPAYLGRRLPAGVEPVSLGSNGTPDDGLWKTRTQLAPSMAGGLASPGAPQSDVLTALSYTPRRSVSPPSSLNPLSAPFTPSRSYAFTAALNPLPSPPPQPKRFQPVRRQLASSSPAFLPSQQQGPRQRYTRTPSPPAPQPSFSLPKATAAINPSNPTASQSVQQGIPLLTVPFKSERELILEREAKQKLVAGILLNKIHVPRVKRRPLIPGEKRAYLGSGLRNEVRVDA